MTKERKVLSFYMTYGNTFLEYQEHRIITCGCLINITCCPPVDNLESWKIYEEKKVDCAKNLDMADSELKVSPLKKVLYFNEKCRDSALSPVSNYCMRFYS